VKISLARCGLSTKTQALSLGEKSGGQILKKQFCDISITLKVAHAEIPEEKLKASRNRHKIDFGSLSNRVRF
jgi:hypothetical protein